MGLVAKEIKPDLLVSFGTSGGVGVGKTGHIKIGDALLASGCVYIDRLRTSSKSSHDWGVFGGPVVPTKNMDKDLGLVKALLGSQISYIVCFCSPSFFPPPLMTPSWRRFKAACTTSVTTSCSKEPTYFWITRSH